ncbi:hypothetical protein AUK04_00430 [Candidatus Roizmanbacteria bacterium CG2_30_33_16]|uniref:NfeD-like C-terminal domain-containing protein n=4 Tax=Candidatus Roizmaniibacteriota TaxID=1752723 RepID=A0A2H0C4E0_9BACT|nr:NfeD family protein [Candidatus Roizmanbacteria bacterium]OIP86557.1 MAG: hypothetical protein AUK04_00430 [Candidatus Roizmanbacteria bacterium CG2_30_33_16]PIP64168.1 MAG: hypothetical protein COW96_04055 [Candidatus Roizmanbacteria bacterium CG22_combo_CG10-13_8_21_14_all_33_16]PIX70761.1 MAG: hypothetical protein COZ39_04280 [Candidatus Roizmanbacteria bacterium CG_4_10_14_3_um_filter_33_21]PJB88003.1 MAG: hypothetical protein CO083_03965 [Candidatus Roizmanbacteria bacterium CG_4_9_14_0
MDNNYILIIIGIGAMVLEILMGAVTGFDLLLVGVIFVISGGLGTLLNSFTTALISTIILTLLYLIVGRRFVKQKLSIDTKETNVERLFRKKAVVVKKIEPNHPGQVKFEGEVWRAESNKTIVPEQEVTIESVSGVTLKVN